MMSDKKIWIQDELTCKPLDSVEEMASFLQNPPAWRTLCVELIPHSDSVVKNVDVNPFFGKHLLETPQTFCHFDPETEEVEREEKRNVQRTLVCHDMANGYHDDSFIDGTGNYKAYTFYNWAAIDIFCYFSHHFITIPPLGWINVAHAHGVKVIGTVITEWAEGVVLWDRLLASEDKWQEFASMLVAIAKTLKFDGWLLNIENKISNPTALLQFVCELHRTLHRELDDAVLLWYDSVTIHGHLNWQNALNDNNRAFFDATDGIFTNYSWRVSDVSSSADEAGERRHDLYVGIDVWGRNFYGGGQFNTQEAIEVAFSHGCSLAIFAPAWTHEAMTDDVNDLNWITDAEDLDSYERFLLRDRALWTSLWPFLNTKLPCKLPFQTSFCRGQGKKRRIYGEAICPVPWFNLRHMQYQPNSSLGPHGYLLSTKANINHLFKMGFLQNKDGIISYRRSLEASRMELKSKDISMTIKADSLTALEQDETVEVPKEPSEVRLSVKRKMKNALRKFFRMKVSKNELVENKQEEQNNGETTKNELVEYKQAEQNNDETIKNELVESKQEEQNNDETTKNELVENKQEEQNNDKTTKNELVENKQEEQNNDETTEKYESSRKSMVQMSVNLRLGKKTNKTRYGLGYIRTELECFEPFYEDSFVGGSCLKVNPSDEVFSEHRLSRLFLCDFFCENSLIVCVVTKTLTGHDNQFLNIRLNVTEKNGERRKVILVGRNIPHSNPEPSGAEVVNLYPVNDDVDFVELQTYMVLNEPEFYVPVANAYDWQVRYYVVALPGARVTSLSCRCGLVRGPVLLGRVGLCAAAPVVKEQEVHNNS